MLLLLLIYVAFEGLMEDICTSNKHSLVLLLELLFDKMLIY